MWSVSKLSGALWLWGGKRSPPESLLAGYLQSSLCAVGPSQTRGEGDCALAICVMFEICISWSSVVLRLITGSYVSLYTYRKLRTNATWVYGGTHIQTFVICKIIVHFTCQ